MHFWHLDCLRDTPVRCITLKHRSFTSKISLTQSLGHVNDKFGLVNITRGS